MPLCGHQGAARARGVSAITFITLRTAGAPTYLAVLPPRCESPLESRRRRGWGCSETVAELLSVCPHPSCALQESVQHGVDTFSLGVGAASEDVSGVTFFFNGVLSEMWSGETCRWKPPHERLSDRFLHPAPQRHILTIRAVIFGEVACQIWVQTEKPPTGLRRCRFPFKDKNNK